MLHNDSKLTDDIKESLLTLVDHASREDLEVRERQIRLWRKLKLYWDGFQRLWYSEVAHDWRVYQPEKEADQSSYYDKPVNVFRSYLESLFAALSITIPAIKCFPDDADNQLDVMTARAGDKIADLCYKHNDASLLWLHALYILYTEGMVASYRYTKEDKEYGTVKENIYEPRDEEFDFNVCPNCKAVLTDESYCPECMEDVIPEVQTETVTTDVKVGERDVPKSRQKIEVYGGLYVKISNYAMKQKDCGYLIWAYETHYSFVRSRYPKLDIHEGSPFSAQDYYERWGRTSTQYMGIEPTNNVTCRNCWFRPEFYHILDEDKAKELRKLFPDGVKIIMADDKLAEVEGEKLDDCWTISQNPLSDYLNHEPPGQLLVNIQEITNDLIALVLQTIEHGIPQTFADPSVLNFNMYSKTQVAPGIIFPAKAKSGGNLSQSFHEVKTATLSREIEPFMQWVQQLGQLVSGALPSLFGGQAAGNSRTAAEYAMSRAQALQRLQITWKTFLVWWKKTFAKVIEAYIENIINDERVVQQDEMGNFVNIFIRKAELQGKIGNIELEATESLPITFAQKKDSFMELLQLQIPEIVQAFTAPENIGKLAEVFGFDNFKLPNQNDIEKQLEEVQILVRSEPIIDPELGIEVSSVPIDLEVDNHLVEADTAKRWLVSPAGRQAKEEAPEGYRNVLLHLKEHLQAMQPVMPPNDNQPQLPTAEQPLVEETGENGLNNQYSGGNYEPSIVQ